MKYIPWFYCGTEIKMRKLQRTKNSVRNFIWGIINKSITLLLPFFIRNVIINVLGKEYLGLNNLFTSILNVLSLAELGVGSAMVYAMYKPIAEENREMICALLSLYKKLYRIIGLVIFVIGMVLLPFLPFLIKGGVKGININVLYLIFLLDTVLSYLMYAYKNSLLIAHQRTDISSNIGSIVHLMLNLFQLIILIVLKNYYIYILMKPVFRIVNNYMIKIVTERIYPDYKPSGQIAKEQRTEIFQHIKALLGHKIGVTVISSADSLVISAFLGLDILAIYSNYYYIISFVISIMGILFDGMLAGIGNSIVTETKQKNYYLFKNINFVTMWFVTWCTVCLLCLFQPFMKIWMGEKMLLSNSSLYFIVLYYYTWQFRCTGLYFKDAAGMWKADFWKPYVAAVVNILGNIILVKTIGINGVFISTIICMIFIYFPWETKVVFEKLLKRSCKEYLICQIIYSIEALFICIVTYLICESVSFTGDFEIVVRGVICITLPNALFLIFNSKNVGFKYVNDKFRKMCGKLL